MLAGPNLFVVVHAEAGAAAAGPAAGRPDTRDAPPAAGASAAVPGRITPLRGTAGAAVPGRTAGGAAGVPAEAPPAAGAGVPGTWAAPVDGPAAPPAGDGAGVPDGGTLLSEGDGDGDGVSGSGDGEGEVHAGSVVGDGDGVGWVRCPGGACLPAPGAGGPEGCGLGPRTTEAQTSSEGTPASMDAVAAESALSVVSGAGTRDTALDAGTPAERTSTAPSAAAAVPRRRPPWKPVSVRVSSDF
jgi:hypothetical protein